MKLKFKHIQEAFDVLKARLEEEEEEKLWTNMEYVASIEKGPTGVGFGMVVVEDAKKSQIIAKVGQLRRVAVCISACLSA